MNPAAIKQARQSLGLSQTEMCRALGLTSVMTYAKWEQGTSKPTAAAINAISMLAFLQRHGLLQEWLAQQTPAGISGADCVAGLASIVRALDNPSTAK